MINTVIKSALAGALATMNSSYPPDEALQGSAADFARLSGPDLITRVGGFSDWATQRRSHSLWPYSKSIEAGPEPSHCSVRDDSNQLVSCVNFASQDYLGLSLHPDVRQAAIETIQEVGLHSAGSTALMGNTRHALQLESELSSFLKMDHTVLYPTGWAAGFGAIKGLIRSTDHVVLDALAHNCLQVGAMAATKNVHFHKHLKLESVRMILNKIRKTDPDNAILVVTEGLFSMDSDSPDLPAMQTLCREFNAFLMVDVAHDLGSLGEDGTGCIGMQGMLGQCDIVMGSFSKTFASNGGFVACNSAEVKEYQKYFSPSCTFSNALSPVQASSVLKALDIVRSKEGAVLRRELMDNVLYLRQKLQEMGLEVLGDPSAVVPVKVGDGALARIISRNLLAIGGAANLVEYPAVAKGSARLRLQVMATHSRSDIDMFIEMLKCAMESAAVKSP